MGSEIVYKRQEVNFTSDPQTQITANKSAIAEAQSDINDIIDGSQTVGKATQDAKGNVIDETYALLPTSVTDTSRASGQWVVSVGDPGGTLLLGTFAVYDTNITLHISGGIATSSGDTTTDVDVFISTANHVVYKAEYYVRSMYTTSSLTGLYYTLDDSHNLRVFAAVPAYGKAFVSAEVASGTIIGRGQAGLQYPSGGAYLERKDYFATDPSKLEPSTANGWTQTTATGSLPSAGVYMIQPNGNYSAAVGLLFFNGNDATGAIMTSVYSGVSLVRVRYEPSEPTVKWTVYEDGENKNISAIRYKRIA